MAAMLERLSKGWLTALVVAALTVGSVAVAQEFRADHPDTYVVKRGDTLWDIAGKFLRKPWLWPEIWQANPQIRNPHLIYPGDVISLAYLDRVGLTPGPRDQAPIDAIPLADVEKYLKDLRVVDQFDQLPYVVGLEEDHLRVAQGQIAYLRGVENAQPGQRFLVVRPTVRYTHLARAGLCCDLFEKDDLNYRGRRDVDFAKFWNHAIFPDKGGETLGYELMRVGAGTVTRGEGHGIDVATLLLDEDGREIRVGDRILPVDPQPYDLQFFPHAPKQTAEYGRLRVLAVSDMLTSGGSHDVIAISGGAREGIDNGTVFSLWRTGSNVVDRVEHSYERPDATVDWDDKVRLPDEFAGHAIVFRTFDKVSYALVMDGTRPVRVGYQAKHPDATY
jgi:hypothetical protein